MVREIFNYDGSLHYSYLTERLWVQSLECEPVDLKISVATALMEKNSMEDSINYVAKCNHNLKAIWLRRKFKSNLTI